MSQDYVHGPRRHDSQPLPSTVSHSPSSFQEVFTATPRDKGEKGYARSHLEDQGIIRPVNGRKRKRADENTRSENHKSISSTPNSHRTGSSLPKRRSPPFTGPDFKYSRYKEALLAAASENCGTRPLFKELASIQRDRLSASMPQITNDTRSHERTPSKKRRVEQRESSSRTPDASLTGSKNSSSATLSKGSSTSPNSFNRATYNTKNWDTKSPAPSSGTSKRRPFDSMSSATTLGNDRSSSSDVDGKRRASSPLGRTYPSAPKNARPRSLPDGRGSDDTEGIPRVRAMAEEPGARPGYKPPNASKYGTPHAPTKPGERRPVLATEHVNPNGTKISRGNDIVVPTIDREIQYPPPDLPSLTRVLNQVPTILTDLNNKQTKLIRELAVRVNDQQKEIDALRSENTKLDERSYQTETNVAEYVRKKFAEMEKRFDDQIEALQEENDRLAEHVNSTGERIATQVNNKIASMGRVQETTPAPNLQESVVIDIPDEEESGQEETTGLFTPLTTPQK